MARTLTNPMEAQRILDGVNGIWLIEGTFDQYGLATITKRFASRNYTLSGNDYDGILTQRGLDLGMLKIKSIGGLSVVAGFSYQVRDEEDESNLIDTHILSNDTVIVYFLFPTGTEVSADRIELMRGVVEKNSTGRNIWKFTVKDGSKKDLQMIPNETVNPITYPYAYSPGAIIPEAFGNLNIGDTDGVGSVISLAPCRFLNRHELIATSSFKKKLGGTPYQWYEQARGFGEVFSFTEPGDGTFSIDGPSRILVRRPSRANASNDVTDWYKTADGDDTVGAVIANTDNLDVYLSGCPRLGEMTDLSVFIIATGNYTVTVKDSGVVLVGPNAVSNDQVIPLVFGNYTASWDIELLNVEIDGTAAATIWEIYLQITFDDFLDFSGDEPRFFQKATGFDDQIANYNDGNVITGVGTALRNPAHQLQALFRATNLHNLPTARVNATTMTAAAASRNNWYFDFWMHEQVSDDFLDRFGFEAGLAIFPQDNQWDVSALDKTRDPQHFFHAIYSSPVTGNIGKPESWVYDLEIQPADASKIFNELNIRYAVHPATGVPQRSIIASGQYRLTGTCSTNAATSKLIDATATFQTDTVLVDERIYIAGDTDYEVVSIDSEIQLEITPIGGGAVTANTAKSYYLGPNINGNCFISQQAFKVIQALGGNRQRTFLDDAGFISQFIRDPDTAQKFLDYAIDWFSQPRYKIRFPLFYEGVRLQPGDIFMFEHPRLKSSLKGDAMTALTANIVAGTTVFDVTAGTAGLLRDDDWCWIQDSDSSSPECIQVATGGIDAPNNQVTFDRGKLATTAVSHASGTSIYRMTTKWIAVGVRPMTPNDPRIIVEAEQVPLWYLPVGRVVAAGYPQWVDATEQQRPQSGWGTLRNGRVVDEEADSAISYVGPAVL